MDKETKQAVETIVNKYKTWLALDNVKLRYRVNGYFGDVRLCPLCTIYNNQFNCGKCPAKAENEICFDQPWFDTVTDAMSRFMSRYNTKGVRKGLKERIEFYEQKLNKED